MFDYISNIRSHHTVPCTAEILHTVMRSTIVGQTCAEIADCHEQLLRGEMSREDFETKKTELKKRLPAFCFHAHFKNGRRLNAEAVPSGLSILDIDHIGRHSEVGPSPALPMGEGEEQPKEQPKEQSKELSKESVTLMETLKRHLFTCTPITDEKTLATLKRLGIVLIHKTPSGEGLRLVFIIPQGMGLVEGQQWLAQQIGLKAFDEACKDLARCSFAVPEEYVLFLDEEELFKDVRAGITESGSTVGAGFIPALTPQGATNVPQDATNVPQNAANVPQDGNITDKGVRAGINPAPTSVSGSTNAPGASGSTVGAGFIPALPPQGDTNTPQGDTNVPQDATNVPQDGNITDKGVRAGINPAPTSVSSATNVPSVSGATNVPSASGSTNAPGATDPTVVNDGLTKPLFVFDLCREQAGLKDVDINARGSRHNSLLAILSVGAARLLSEAEAMAVVERRMPEFFKESDCRQLIHDFYAKYHDDSKIMSATVQRINARAEQLAQLSKEKKDKDEEEPEEPADTTPTNPTNAETAIPPIPGLKQSLTGVPEQMRMPALCALLPMAAAYADDVTFRYCDGREQRLGLMSIVVGEQASGKSVCKDIIDLWRQPMDEDDEQGRRKEDEWKKKRKNRRANEKLDPEPEVLIRDVPITISCSTLLKRLKNAQGHTLYSFCSELDTLRKTNGAGSWSSKYDIYRLAFDHDEWGQDYNSDQAESGMVSVGYNWTILGTYGALGKCFKGENIENGLSSRVIVSEMPDSAFAPMPTFQDRKDRDAQAILDAVGTLRAKHGFVDTPRLRKAIAQWVEDKRQQAMERIDRVMDTYRRRAAVIGMRCGVVACLLSGEKETKHVIDFALMMAEYVLQEQCRLFGDVLRKQYATDADDTRRNSKNRAVFDRLADTFTSHDILALKTDISESTARTIICRWKEAGWIGALPRHKGDKGMKYKKL